MNQEAEFSTSGVTPFRDSLEDMADMDELFGSDGDSDNDQRGNDPFISYKNANGVSGYLITLIFLVQIKFGWFSRTFLLAFRETGLWFLFAGKWQTKTIQFLNPVPLNNFHCVCNLESVFTINYMPTLIDTKVV